MSQEGRIIAQLIDSIAHKRDHLLRFPVMSGKLISVDPATMTAKVELSVDDAEAATEGINLNVVLNNTGGVYMIPADGAYCIVAEIDGPGKWELLKASQYTKVVIQAGTLIQMNDGSKGGVPLSPELVKEYNAIKKDLNDLKNIFLTTWVVAPNDGGLALKTAAATWAATNLALTVQGDIENAKIKQG